MSSEFESLLEYVAEEHEDIYSLVADYFDFQNRIVKVSKSELDFIKNNMSKSFQKKLFGGVKNGRI